MKTSQGAALMMMLILSFAVSASAGWYNPAYDEQKPSQPNGYSVTKLHKEAIEPKPDYAEAHYKLGFTYWEKGLYDKAIASYKKVTELKPDYAEAHYNLGTAYGEWEVYNYDKAITSFKKAIELKPDYAEAHGNLGVAYVSEGRKYAAAEHFYKAGLLFLKQGSRDDALVVYDFLVRYVPNHELTSKLHRKLYHDCQNMPRPLPPL
jgi:tetratricopeptide (TPR) repeat protein